MLKDKILEQNDEGTFEKLSTIMCESFNFFKKKCKIKESEKEEEDEEEDIEFTVIALEETEQEEKTEYSYTESEYNFDDIDESEKELKIKLGDNFSNLEKELKAREFYENIKISKKKKYF